MDKEQVRKLLEKHRVGKLSDDERAILESWYLDNVSRQETKLDDKEVQANLNLVKQAVINQTKPHKGYVQHIWKAAAALVVVSSVTWYVVKDVLNFSPQQNIVHQYDVLPGGQKAVLTLADGRSIDLSTEQSGIIFGDGITYQDGSFVLSPDVSKSENLEDDPHPPVVGHSLISISTPKGGTYQVTLSDGTKVWLNAATTLRYPARFDDQKRVVTLEGEAYFEVAQLASLNVQKSKNTRSRIPFIVKSRGQDITVLGTKFNVSAYADDSATKTTLISGKVNVFAHDADREVLLTPGQEAVLSQTGFETHHVDVALATGWKSGKFRFEETELREVMNQLSRWYDIEVEFRDTMPEKYFYGIINRDRTLSTVLDLLKEGGVNFKLEKTSIGHKVIVLPE
ncbi:FecR family protein [Parapedobacter tibetensis]|uniref:FecR family protein n=1 Tax=Parapedobacter tibetensis TaxID=2972951 RepID=UPI00214D4B13|nr:FecR family protein [Parapedobacter tibetensis]